MGGRKREKEVVGPSKGTTKLVFDERVSESSLLLLTKDLNIIYQRVVLFIFETKSWFTKNSHQISSLLPGKRGGNRCREGVEDGRKATMKRIEGKFKKTERQDMKVRMSDQLRWWSLWVLIPSFSTTCIRLDRTDQHKVTLRSSHWSDSPLVRATSHYEPKGERGEEWGQREKRNRAIREIVKMMAGRGRKNPSVKKESQDMMFSQLSFFFFFFWTSLEARELFSFPATFPLLSLSLSLSHLSDSMEQKQIPSQSNSTRCWVQWGKMMAMEELRFYDEGRDGRLGNDAKSCLLRVEKEKSWKRHWDGTKGSEMDKEEKITRKRRVNGRMKSHEHLDLYVVIPSSSMIFSCSFSSHHNSLFHTTSFCSRFPTTGCIWYAVEGKMVWIIHVYFLEVIYDVSTREVRNLTLRTQDRKFSSSLPSSSFSFDKWTLSVSESKEANDRKWPENESSMKVAIVPNLRELRLSPLRSETWALHIHSSQKCEGREKDETRIELEKGAKERVAWRRNATFWVGSKPALINHCPETYEEKGGERERVKKNFILSVSFLLNRAFSISLLLFSSLFLFTCPFPSSPPDPF